MTLRTGEKRVCLFAAFDPRIAAGGAVRILPATIHYLAALHGCGFETHLALSGADRIHPEDAKLFEAMDVRPHLRPNIGHDFGAWQHLIGLGCTENADRILLANDSVFGPLAPLAPILHDMDERGADVWGMVESREGRWHLQSWFLCFSAQAFASTSVRQVFQMPFAAMNRDQIVLHGELGLGAAILADGLRWDARWRSPTKRLRRLIPGNPMHLDYMSVVRSGAVPFLKAELIRDNPARIGWSDRWPALLGQSPTLTSATIADALAARPGLPHRRQTPIMRALYAAISSDRWEAARAAFSARRS